MIPNEKQLKIRELRLLGQSYRDVANNVGLTRDRVKDFCRNHSLLDRNIGLKNIVVQSVDERESEFIKRLAIKFPTLEYKHGFQTRLSMVTVECVKCGNTFEKSAQCVYSSKVYSNEPCPKCREKNKPKPKAKYEPLSERLFICKHCGKDFISKRARKYCSSKCGYQSRHKQQSYIKVCDECGKPFETNHRGRKYCSTKCSRKKNCNHYEKQKKREQKYRLNGDVDKSITLKGLMKRDNNICYICGKPCDISDGQWIDGVFYTGNSYPTIDHVKPISKGGAHTWNNVKLAHMICNSKKSNKELDYESRDSNSSH